MTIIICIGIDDLYACLDGIQRMGAQSTDDTGHGRGGGIAEKYRCGWRIIASSTSTTSSISSSRRNLFAIGGAVAVIIDVVAHHCSRLFCGRDFFVVAGTFLSGVTSWKILVIPIMFDVI